MVSGESGDACGDLLFNADATYENGYCWGYGGTAPPYYGAFAECYSQTGRVCNVVLDLTTSSGDPGVMDLFVWSDDGGMPGAVLCLETAVDPGPIALWPSVSRHVLPLDSPCCVEEMWWCGYWGNFTADCSWFVAADADGPGGCPFTNILPGMGLPTGWNHVSAAWGPTQAIGIGAELTDCEPTPVIESSWGRVKDFYQY